MHKAIKIRDLNLFVEMIKTKSRKEIAEHFGTTEATVTRAASCNGFNLTEIRKEHRLQVIEDNPMLCIDEIAEKLNCSSRTVINSMLEC